MGGAGQGLSATGSSGSGTGMLLNILQSTRQTPQRIMQLKKKNYAVQSVKSYEVENSWFRQNYK